MANEYERDALDRMKEDIRRLTNKVPQEVMGGSVQTTRKWLKAREQALKLIKKPGVTSAELMGAMPSLTGMATQRAAQK
jgi:hypothetical protein